jgi:uncharacterized protein YbgA (DUF1722 family)/uncharacterized protein YbbK (DUF523 family)
MRESARPNVVVSKCIEFAACRYNGMMIPSPVVKLLKAHVDFMPVCPEVDIGLGVPRKPIRIVAAGGERRLVQPETDRDVTDEMKRFTEAYLGSIGSVDGFILKFRSPSCGIKDVKIYSSAAKGASAGKGAGFFGGEVVSLFPHLAIEDEGRLKNYKIREHFLTRLFALAAFRRVKVLGSMRELVRFHTDNKLLLMAYSQKALRSLGRTVANPGKRPVSEVISNYEREFGAALSTAPRYTSCINVLMHAMGYFSKQLSSKEKSYFLETLQEYRDQRIPLSVPVGIVKSYVVRFEEPYLAEQTFFDPYPEAMVSVTDSGKGRSL